MPRKYHSLVLTGAAGPRSFPFLRNVERPDKLQVIVAVVVRELGRRLVVPSGHHACGRLIWLDCRGDV